MTNQTLSKSISVFIALLLCSFVFQANAITTNSTPLFKLSDVVPSGKQDLELMTLGISERGMELTAKFQSAVAGNRDWFMDYVKNAPEGPLPYDAKLGLTKEEYAEYLDTLKKRQLVSTGTSIPCLFLRDGDTVTLHLAETDTPISKIVLNLETGELITSVGSIGKPEWTSNDGSSGVLGEHDACSWSYEKSDLEKYDVRLVKLSIWRLKPSGRILWRFQDSELVSKESKQAFDVVFEPKPAKALESITHGKGQPESNQSLKRIETAFEICATVGMWTWVSSGITALVAALLSFFTRTLQQARMLSQAGLWLGIISLIASITIVWLTVSNEGFARRTNGDNLSLISAAASAPLLAFIVNRWSRKKLKAVTNAPSVS